MKYLEETLILVDVEKNHSKFYMVIYDAFGDSPTVTRRWGRLGTKGQVKTETFETRFQAIQTQASLVSGKLAKGYRHAGLYENGDGAIQQDN